jgi:uncharacterized membrane protein
MRSIPTFLMLFFLAGSLTGLPAKNSTYQIPEISVEAEITPAGTVHIHETRTYQFQGSFSWADYRLPKSGFTEIRNIRLAEGAEGYINENSGETDTFTVSESDDEIVIKWHFSAKDEKRSFTLSYELSGAIAIGPEWSEFFWNYLAAGREKPTGLIDIQLRLPSETGADQLYAWSRVQEEQVSITISDGCFQLSGRDITRSQSVELRTLFPTSVFDETQVTITHPELTPGLAAGQEEAYQQEMAIQAEREAWFRETGPGFTALLALLGIALFIITFRKYGIRHRTGTLSDRETTMIPGPESPAVAGRLLNHSQTMPNHLSATLFDLARRGWLLIEEQKKETKWNSGQTSTFIIKRQENEPEDPLSEWEEDFLRFIRSRLNDGKHEFSKIFGPGNSATSAWYANWVKLLKDDFNQHGWIDKESYKGAWINGAGQLFLVVLSILLIVYGAAAALVSLIFCSVLMALSFLMIRRTPQGEESYRRWRAYRKGLQQADGRVIMKGPQDRHFIYATAFGLTGKQLENVISRAGNKNTSTSTLFPWIFFLPGSTTSPATVASSLSTLSASGTSSFSGTSGGSGASAGRSGGGASGGAG